MVYSLAAEYRHFVLFFSQGGHPSLLSADAGPNEGAQNLEIRPKNLRIQPPMDPAPFILFPKAPPEQGSRLDFGVQGLASVLPVVRRLYDGGPSFLREKT